MIKFITDATPLTIEGTTYDNWAGSLADGEAMVAAAYVSWMKLTKKHTDLKATAETGGNLVTVKTAAEKSWAVAVTN